MPCNCDNRFLVQSEYGTVICTKCGIETKITLEPHEASCNQFDFSPPIFRVYSRPDRWKTIVSKIVGVHSGPPRDDPVWPYLKSHSHNITCPQDILALLRKSKLKNKHYQCIHIFSKAFLKTYSPPNVSPNLVTKNLNIYFDHINHIWLKQFAPSCPFISYAWLLEQALSFYGFREYLPYLKKLMCKNRRQKYVTLLNTLYRKHGIHAGKKSHGWKDIHLQNGSDLQETHRNQLLMPPTPAQLHDAHYRLSAEREPSGWVQTLKDTCSLPQDTLEEFAELLELSQGGHAQLHDLKVNLHNG